MAKIMLVEDDNNLREIYEARLLAEGYEIVSAKDGEEALAMAVKEKPDLIISDVMMPKISGFDMLDILRSTPETKNTKVIMMTALSQAEDKTRADKLGADRYLVKSQVTLEDVAKVAKEVLEGDSSPAPTVSAAAAVAAPVATVPEEPTPVATTPVAEPVTSVAPSDPPAAQSTADESASVTDQINQFIANTPAEPPAEVSPLPIEVATAPVETTEDAADNAAIITEAANEAMGQNSSDDSVSGNVVAGKKVISPINDLSAPGPDLTKLASEQEAKDNATEAVQPPVATSVISPEGTVLTPESAAAPEAAPKTADTPPQPGDKIDPNSVAL